MIRKNRVFLWRGMVGGVIGGIAWSFVAIVIEAVSNPRGVKGVFNYVFVLALPAFVGLNMVIGAALGALIGVVIWSINIRTKQNIGLAARAAIGTVCVVVVSVIYVYARNRGNQEASSTFYFGFYVAAFSLVVGAVSGIIAGTKHRTL